MSKSAKKLAKSPLSAKAAKPAQQTTGEPKTNKTDARSKQARVIAMLQSPTGTTIAAIMKATGWQAHSVRGFISTAGKKHGVEIESTKNEAGDRLYRGSK